MSHSASVKHLNANTVTADRVVAPGMMTSFDPQFSVSGNVVAAVGTSAGWYCRLGNFVFGGVYCPNLQFNAHSSLKSVTFIVPFVSYDEDDGGQTGVGTCVHSESVGYVYWDGNSGGTASIFRGYVVPNGTDSPFYATFAFVVQ